MNQKILIFWHPLWSYQIYEFLKKNVSIDIVVVSLEDESSLNQDILNKVNNVFYYRGPSLRYFTDEDENNLADLIIDIVKKNNYNFIFPAWRDKALSFFATINYKLKLPGVINYKPLEGKHNYYKIFNQLNIPTPVNFTDCPKYPLLYKPSFGSSGEGIVVCNDKNELDKILSERNENFILQEYIKGATVCIVGHVYASIVYIDLIYDIEVSNFPFRVETGFSFPSCFNHLKDDILYHLQTFVNFIKLDNSPFMLDIIVDTKGNFFFIDFSPRVSYSIFDLMHYIDNQDYFYHLANKILNGVNFTLNASKCFVKKFFLTTDVPFEYLNIPQGILDFKILQNKKFIIENDFDIENQAGYIISIDNNLNSCQNNIDQFILLNSSYIFKFFD